MTHKHKIQARNEELNGMNRMVHTHRAAGLANFILWAPYMRTQCIFASDDDLSFDNDIVRICNFPKSDA